MSTTTNEATRCVGDGTRETAAFLGTPGEAVFACLHEPSEPPTALVVVCSSIGAEWKHNYRREVLLGRALARAGVATVRFHYTGVGNSDDGTADFDRMVLDAALIERWALERCGTVPVAYFGAKFGALVAAAAAARRPGAPLAAWGAALDGASYFRELFRVERVGRVAAAGSRLDGEALGPRESLERGLPADLLGYTVEPAFYDSALTRSLERELAAAPRVARLFEIGEPRAALADVAARLAAHEVRVEIGTVPAQQNWWLHDKDWTADERRDSVIGLIEETLQWLLSEVPAPSTRHPSSSRPGTTRSSA
ncbi:hypothetical protein CIB93_20620 [Streptomyces sp. WZ.A104]|uniref:serine aminopeptidase domain-containing protein n=1 Tax=Streptomyces sp. WZ.A104 TaxID=2023771 RepID=UPI000BBC37DD|nr:alpha/beta hydrolase [Streptomyces sp. WZ.A104]PCG84221.1 hypothetical protein CIB93_20620 [Streptomyces sp. WZ.A104]